MSQQNLEAIARAQAAVQAELKQFLADAMAGDNAPVDVIITFRCPDGQFGYYSTPGDTIEMVGMLEAAKANLLVQAVAQRAQPQSAANDAGAPGAGVGAH